MKTLRITLMVLLITLVTGLKSQIPIWGNLAGLFGGSMPAGYYRVPFAANVYVPAGAVFTIDPGVKIEFDVNSSLRTFAGSRLNIMDSTEFSMKNGSFFDIKGDFFVYGIPGREAVFHKSTLAPTLGWDGINFVNCVTDTVYISHAKIVEAYKHGVMGIATQAGAVCSERSTYDVFEIRNTDFEDNDVKIDGGAIFFNLSSCLTHLVLSDNMFVDNVAGNNGGAVYFNVQNTNVKLLHNKFIENTSNDGGAVYVFDARGSVMGFDINYFENNIATNNGGACLFTGKIIELVLSRNNFFKNSANNFDGGAVYVAGLNHSNPVTLMLNTFENNTARLGGAVCTANDNGKDKNYFNNLFIYNEASVDGGAVFFERNYSFVNNTFTENHAMTNAGALYATSNILGTYGISNNILWADTPNETNNILSVGNTYPNFFYCDIDDPAFAGAGGSIYANPLFVNPGLNDFRLQTTSPCLDNGDPTFVTGAYYPFWTTDLDFTARVKGTYVDMGAYELFVAKAISLFKSSMEEPDSDSDPVKIYPNPAKDNVTVKFTGNIDDNVIVSVYDLSGKKILRAIGDKLNNQDGMISVDVSQIPGGVYMMEIVCGNNRTTQKLIVK